MGSYFVGGIGTDIGKSVAVAAMARYLLASGANAITMKPVQTGNDGFSEDIELHRRFMKRYYPEDDSGLTCPVIFKFPASAHLAAAIENSKVDTEAINAAAAKLADRYDTVLIEGAGGLMVPLSQELLTIDYVAERNWPVILVSGSYLGSLNHTILSLEALAARRIKLAGVIYNLHGASHKLITADTSLMIRKYMKRCGYPDILVELPDGQNPDSPLVDFSPVFSGE